MSDSETPDQNPVVEKRPRDEVLQRIHRRWKDLPHASPEEIARWIEEGREPIEIESPVRIRARLG
jgi:hypothetical protein